MDLRQDLGSELGSEEPAHHHPFRKCSEPSQVRSLGAGVGEEGGERHALCSVTPGSGQDDRMQNLVRTPGQCQESLSLKRSGKTTVFGKPSRDSRHLVWPSTFIVSLAPHCLASALVPPVLGSSLPCEAVRLLLHSPRACIRFSRLCQGSRICPFIWS